jgi:formylglycine-generating enzyme required for sulfatase activity
MSEVESDPLVSAEPSSSFSRLESLFHEGLDLAPAELPAFLARVRESEPSLAVELEALLAADAEPEADDGLTRGAAAWVADLPASPRAPERVGPYKLIEPLGEGGMGQVFLARRDDGTFERDVAVKFLHSGLASAELLARFDAERRTLARLEHPGIARLIDAGSTAESGPYFVLELVAGERFDRYADERELGLTARVELWAQVIAAVAYAHERMVVHRDLKPSNILVEADGTARLLDFGIAKVLGDEDNPELTRTGERALTPAYASPEQVRGEEVTPRSDVYALGVIGYELFGRRRAYGSGTTKRHELERAVLERQPESLKGRIPGDLDRILQRCLSKEPERRYANAGSLARDLERFRGGLPVQARPDSALYRTRLWVRRKPMEALLAAALILGAVAGAVLFVNSSLRQRGLLEDVARLVDVKTFDRLLVEQRGFGAGDEGQIPLQDAWLAEVEGLNAREPELRSTLEQLQARLAAGWSGAQADFAREFWVPELERFLVGLEELNGADVHRDTAARVRAYRGELASLRERSIEAHAERWQQAVEAIGDRAGPYLGLEIAPQLGLVPLGPDPASGLWEFWHVQSGAEPRRSEDGSQWDLTAEAGVVLVLIPGGPCAIGAQSEDEEDLHYDPEAEPRWKESPVAFAELGPYFLSKYELTQGQWVRLAGYNPSDYTPDEGAVVGGREITLRNPVEQVNWVEAQRVLHVWGLQLPTEAQWEAAARAGTETPYWTGELAWELDGFANLADRYAEAHGDPNWTFYRVLDDGHTVHAPVGTYGPNPLGLHELTGNLCEWVRDAFTEPGEDNPPRPGDGLRGAPVEDFVVPPEVVSKGGSYANPPRDLRHSRRWENKVLYTSRTTGIRPGRDLRP